MPTTASARHRYRLSAWVAVEDFLGGGAHVVSGVFKDIVRPGDKRPIIDDISLQRTIQEQKGTNVFDSKGRLVDIDLGVRFDPMILQFANVPDQNASRAQKAAVVREVIDHCHQVLGIQCLIGFTHGDATGSEIARWLNLPIIEEDPLGNSPRHDRFCDKVLAFCQEHMPGFDGVSFDLEGIPVVRPPGRDPKKELDYPLYQQYLATGQERDRLQQLGHQETDFYVWRVTTNLTHLYRTLALKSTSPPLRPPPAGGTSKVTDRGWDRIVAFAAAGTIGAVPPPGPANPPDKPRTFYKSRHLEHDADGSISRVPGQNDFVTRSGTLAPAEPSFRMHDYFGVRGVRNAIIRPMAYDNFFNTDPPRICEDWHADIVRYVKRVMNLHPGNFQLGVKTMDGDGQRDHIDKKTGRMVKGMDGVVKDPARVRARGRDLLAPEELGLALFPASVSFWADANAGLNATNPGAGLRDEPVQVPLNAKAEAFYTPTRPPLKP